MNKIYVIILSILFSAYTQSEDWQLTSPDGQLLIQVEEGSENGKLLYQIFFRSDTGMVPVLLPSPLGIERADQRFMEGLSISSGSGPETIQEPYELLHGKRRENPGNANQLKLHIQNSEGARLTLELRAYNQGVAFRYIFPEEDSTAHTITAESSGFHVPESGTAFIQPYPDAYPAYEQYYKSNIPVGTPSPNKAGWAFPALFQIEQGRFWMLISEAGLEGSYCGSRLQQEAPGGKYMLRFPDASEGNGEGEVLPSSTLPWLTPWRVIMVGTSPGSIVESTLITDLSSPSMVEETSWIKPGRASWSWWSDGRSPRNPEKLKEFIDLAAEMSWEYSLVDAGWPNLEEDKLKELVDYASAKSVGLILWYHSGGHPRLQHDEQMQSATLRREQFRYMQKLGIKGVKVDFFLSDKQLCIEQYHDILKDAAEFQLMVNFHGCTLPRGWSRAYPHLMTMEAVVGEEMYRAHDHYPANAPAYNTILPFIRNVAGPMDYTPTGFSNSKYPHLTSDAHELALPVLFESGWVHFVDDVDTYLNRSDPEKEYLRKVPASWDDIRFIEGYPGKEAVLARRSGGEWYIAGINGEDREKTVQFDLSFLELDQYQMLLLNDGLINREVASEERGVGPSDKLEIKMAPYGGFVARITPLSGQNNPRP
ncbi:MAG: glycoside hydrolase family 97 protein [Bacteroidetes bacterium]|nr:glycoside hydrolase family 97 protein [Bacteroidota bacterium]